MVDPVADLLAFIDRSPTPFHAVAETRRRLDAAGFQEVLEGDPWELSPGDRRYAVRGDTSVVAFQVGGVQPAEGGFRVIGAHTDSPNLRVKPLADVSAQGYRQLAVEAYGGVLLHTWLDRDLSLAGRVLLRDGDAVRAELVDFARPLLRVPNLAIHLYREISTDGLKLNPQTQLVPVTGLESAPALAELVGAELRDRGLAVAPADLLGFDLMAYDVQPAAISGARGEFIHAARLDNLASCHAALCALEAALPSEPPEFTRMVVLYDHEEVGSRSRQGAAGTFLSDALERVVSGFKGGAPQGLPRAASRSMLVSADMAHAVHPNYADRHEPGHRPVIGGGPVIKTHASQAYASDGETRARFASLCARAGVEPQHFASRNDVACGSTIGPITAARVGIPTVDVGNPMLSMHSCREMAGSADVEPMLRVLRLFLGGSADE